VNTRLLLAVLLALVLPAQVRAQQPIDRPAREAAYRTARSSYQAARDAWSERELAWGEALDQHGRARRAGDEGQQEVWLTRALDLARELEMHERLVADADAALDDARSALLATLAQLSEVLQRQRAGASSAAERTRLTTLLEEAESRRDELEVEAQDGVRLQLVYYESIQYDPRDDPESLAAKAELLRSKAEQADSLIVQVDREIDRIGRQVRRARNAQALLTGVERFGDIQAPGAPGRVATPSDVRARTDSTGVAVPAQTPEQQIQQLELLKGELEQARRSFLQRAETFDNLRRRSI
jgi:hypothetical protein